MLDRLTIRFPLAVRVISVLPLLCFGYAGVVRTIGRYSTVCGFTAALILAVYALSYRAEFSRSKIRIRWFPFVVRAIPASEIQYVSEGSPFIITAMGVTMCVWSMSPSNRSDFFHILPVCATNRTSEGKGANPAAAAVRYRKLACAAGFMVLLAMGMLVPFLNDNPWNRYWYPFGATLAILSLILWLALLLFLGMAFIHWQADRDLCAAKRSKRQSQDF